MKSGHDSTVLISSLMNSSSDIDLLPLRGDICWKCLEKLKRKESADAFVQGMKRDIAKAVAKREGNTRKHEGRMALINSITDHAINMQNAHLKALISLLERKPQHTLG